MALGPVARVSTWMGVLDVVVAALAVYEFDDLYQRRARGGGGGGGRGGEKVRVVGVGWGGVGDEEANESGSVCGEKQKGREVQCVRDGRRERERESEREKSGKSATTGSALGKGISAHAQARGPGAKRCRPWVVRGRKDRGGSGARM